MSSVARKQVISWELRGCHRHVFLGCRFLCGVLVPQGCLYYMETTASPDKDNEAANPLKKWLQARTVSLPTCWNRLLAFHFVRSTKQVIWIPSIFVTEPASANHRSPEHLARTPKYPDPVYILNFLGKYFFRHRQLRHLRVEQFNRYLYFSDVNSRLDITAENTIEPEGVGADAFRQIDLNHRNHCLVLEQTAPGTNFHASLPGCPGAVRRKDSRFGVSRLALLEPSGDQREDFYQQKLLTGLAWFCKAAPEKVSIHGREVVQWVFEWEPPPDVPLGKEQLVISTAGTDFSYEEKCKRLEAKFSDAELALLCKCCSEQESCARCKFACGFHRCTSERPPSTYEFMWAPGTLHGGELDIQ